MVTCVTVLVMAKLKIYYLPEVSTMNDSQWVPQDKFVRHRRIRTENWNNMDAAQTPGNAPSGKSFFFHCMINNVPDK